MFKKIIKTMISFMLVVLLCANVYAHRYSNLDSYKWMVEDCKQMRIGLNAQGVSMNIDKVYTYKSSDYRFFYYIIYSGFINKTYVHVYSCRRNSDGGKVDLKAFDTLSYEYGDTNDDVELKGLLKQMANKDLQIDEEALINLRVDMG